MNTPAELFANLSIRLSEASDDEQARNAAVAFDSLDFLDGSKARTWLRAAILERKDTIPNLSEWNARDAGDILLILTAFLTVPQSIVGLQLVAALTLVFLPLAAGKLGSLPEALYNSIADAGKDD